MSLKSRTILGVLLSLLLLGWALRDVSVVEVVQRISDADPVQFGISILIALSAFHIRAFRWGFLLRPLGTPAPFSARTAATFIGFAANNVLPARVGEFARAFVLSRLTPVPAAAAFATLVIERLLDGIVLIGLLFAAMAAPAFPAEVSPGGVDFRGWALTAAVVMGVAAGALLLAVAAPRYAGRIARLLSRFLPERLRAPFIETLRAFAAGLRILTDIRLSAISLILAIGQWSFLALSYFFAFRAFGIDHVPWSGAVFMQSIIALAAAVPSSPGFFGPFEAAARVGLGIWGVPGSQAISFAVGFHIAGFLPVTLIGVWYLSRFNLSWSDVRGSEAVVENEAVENEAVKEISTSRSRNNLS
ncbi:MAG: flippase-like domain-containing protein [Gemmatimonadota bacterium]|jgi:uncharacterized protein (TIRG00374 family)|nr:flippase-like domain-containing protein [Gemmatimonadota bacterium]